MSELENGAQRDAKNGRSNSVEQQDAPYAVKEERNNERQQEELNFAAKQNSEIQSLRSRKPVFSYASSEETFEVVDKMPFHRKESIQRPEVELLKPVHPHVTLLRCKTA